MAILILKILTTIALALLGLLMTWVVFVGTLMANETTKFGIKDYVAILAVPSLSILSIWAMWS